MAQNGTVLAAQALVFITAIEILRHTHMHTLVHTFTIAKLTRCTKA